MRIQYKGGVWKNTEDEILKAAVMKYGKNQWPRIASLLVRKSAKQCKARWFEWLDPSIKKTEWSREEEEKLLHLAKVMPTAWRTIAPMIGRTAAQCIEHYEMLIDSARDAHNAAGGDSAGDAALGQGSAVGALRNKQGESDAVMETKPARPDPIDMDDDEKEMIGEALARLANTKGKKAKRKYRERYLEAAKRMVQIQKERELKAAGVSVNKKRNNRKETDYATEIPFMRTAAAGFFDTREEDKEAQAVMQKKEKIGQLLQNAKEKSIEEKEEEQREKDKAKQKKRDSQDPLAAVGLDKAPSLQEPPLKKARLELPEPLMTDAALEKLVKAGFRPGVPGERAGQPDSEDMTHVSGAPGGAPVSESWASVRQRQVRDMMSVQSAQTPLDGGEVSVSDLGLDGRVTPALSTMRTPNLLATPSFVSHTGVDAGSRAAEKRRKKTEDKELSDRVRLGLLALPVPENEYEFDFDETVADPDEIDATDAESEMLEDAEEELQKREQEERERVPALKERLLSSVAKRNLPIGSVGDMNVDTDSVEFVVQRDVAVLRIVGEFERGERKAHEAIGELESVVAHDGADDEMLLKEAKDLIDAQITVDEANGSVLKDAIDQVVKVKFDISRDEQSNASGGSDKEVGDDGDEGGRDLEITLQREGEQRRKVLEKIYDMQGETPVEEDDLNVGSLWKEVDGEYAGRRVCDLAEAADDETSIVKLIADLKDASSQ